MCRTDHTGLCFCSGFCFMATNLLGIELGADMQVGPTTRRASTALRILCREISAPDTGCTGTSGVRELALPDQIAEVIGGEARELCGFGETQRLVGDGL